ncbi:hypothetical protein HF086_004623 [Spodoptera exigua]|uniref:FP protein C-terminal domain-containing protein n=1 Tax=Spodoptera exigua TaxID=7107 RepID=A0A922M7U7_SPOEX|nr:hypothetical protein HF086_004623 [Spodoptera exigua]
MASAQRTPPKTPISQTQSEPDINSAVEMSEYVNVSRSKRRRNGTSPQGGTNLSLQDVQINNQDISRTLAEQTSLMTKLLADIGEIKSQNNQIKASNAQIRETNEEIIQSMSFMNKQFEDMKKEIEDLRKDRQLQQNYIEQLEKKILDMQHMSRSSGIEIRNIPQDNNETTSTLIKTVCKIGEIVGLPIPESNIRDIYRLPGKSTGPTIPRPIIAQFSTVQTKQSLLSAVRSYNKEQRKEAKINTGVIGLPGKTQPVYIAEQLPPSIKKLFYQTREFAKNKSYQFCWISNGNIFLRKVEGDKQILIRSEKCLQDLSNKHI